VPSAAWDMISMDFVEGLPNSGSVNVILVVIDKFTKYGHFLPLHHPFTTQTVAKLFMEQIYRLHGLPSVIISNRDKVFTGAFVEGTISISWHSIAIQYGISSPD
jgi:hypothetical protein